ncbi:hypothetical protein Q7P37_008504 [Cladosporium fusiforme]
MATTSKRQSLDQDTANNAAQQAHQDPSTTMPFREPVYGSPGDDYYGQSFDERDMERINKPQQLRRKFETVSTIGFTSCVMGSEVLLATSGVCLRNGGLAGLFWSMVWVTFGQFFVVLSLAELASSAPTAGGQYHWVSEHAPIRWQKVLSYCSGWLSMISWQSMVVIECYAISDIIQAVILVNEPTYLATRWRGTLLTMAAALLSSGLNIILASHLSWCEGIFATFHFFAFVPVLVALLIIAPKRSAADVFLHFEQTGTGWSTTTVALFVGQVSNLFVMLGSDGVAHLAEEIEDAGKKLRAPVDTKMHARNHADQIITGVVLPQSMLWSYYINAPLTLAMAAVYCFSVTSIPKVLESPMPFVIVFQDAFQEARPTIAFAAVVLVLVLVVATSSLAATSRQIFAFARDKGLPHSTWLATVDRCFDVPVNAILLTLVFACCMSLINLGSKVAFEAMLSLATVALMSTYLISIGCVLLKRIRGEPLPSTRWSLGRYGLAVNAIAVAYTCWSTYGIDQFFWAFWPSTYNVSGSTFNWVGPLFILFLGCALLTYHLHAKYEYEGPVSYVIKRHRSGRND